MKLYSQFFVYWWVWTGELLWLNSINSTIFEWHNEKEAALPRFLLFRVGKREKCVRPNDRRCVVYVYATSWIINALKMVLFKSVRFFFVSHSFVFSGFRSIDYRPEYAIILMWRFVFQKRVREREKIKRKEKRTHWGKNAASHVKFMFFVCCFFCVSFRRSLSFSMHTKCITLNFTVNANKLAAVIDDDEKRR